MAKYHLNPLRSPYPVHWLEDKTSPKPIIYFSGILGKQGNGSDEEMAEKIIHRKTGLRHRCLSSSYIIDEKRCKIAMDYLLGQKVGIFLDSGAFTLQKSMCRWKDPVNMEDLQEFCDYYCDVLHVYGHRVDWYASVDFRRNTEATAIGQALMHERGWKPTPVFHCNNDIGYFQEYLDAGAPLIAIAKPLRNPGQGLTIKSKKHYRQAYDQIFNLIAQGGYKVALHGLAQTGVMMFDYPWYSVDSTSWAVGSKAGSLLDIDPIRHKISTIYIAPKLEAEKKEGGSLEGTGSNYLWRHMPKSLREPILARAAKWDLTEKDLLEDYISRDVYNIRVYLEAIQLQQHKPASGGCKWQTLI